MKENILEKVGSLAKKRAEFVKETTKFADEICYLAESKIKEGPTHLALGSDNGKRYYVASKGSNVGSETMLFVEDGEGQRSISYATVGGGSFYLHGDFNARTRRADYSDCLEFIEFMKSKFGEKADKSLAAIEEKLRFFEEKQEAKNEQ